MGARWQCAGLFFYAKKRSSGKDNMAAAWYPKLPIFQLTVNGRLFGQ
jgi:hypothetical protein